MIKLSILFIRFSIRSNQRKHTIAYTHKRALSSLMLCNNFVSYNYGVVNAVMLSAVLISPSDCIDTTLTPLYLI